MDYEKAYKDALEWMRDLYSTMEGSVKEDAGHFFPELKESEDERIRNRIIGYLKQDIEEHPERKERINEMLAYLEKQKDILRERAQNITANMLEDRIEGIQHELIEFLSNAINASWIDIIKSADSYAERIKNIIEKQKEQKPITTYIPFNPDDYEVVENGNATELRRKQKEQKPLICDGEIEDRKRDIVAAIRKYYPADYAEYLTSFLKGLSPEDNSEDEYGQKMLGIAYKLMYEHIPENLRTQEFWDSLKFMREYTGKVAIIHSYEQQPAEQLGGTFTSYDMAKTFTEGQNYVIAHPEKFDLCKPAEWSEDIIRKAVKEVGLTQQQIDWFKTNVFPPKEELAKMLQAEYNRGKGTGEAEGYEKGYNKGYKDASESVSHRFPIMPSTPSGFGCDGTHCTNPQMDCINCPRKSTGGMFNTASSSGDETLKAEWKLTKEQMEVLNEVIGDEIMEDTASCEAKAEVLKTLYADLQKLL